jgi:hypothetical protein
MPLLICRKEPRVQIWIIYRNSKRNTRIKNLLPLLLKKRILKSIRMEKLLQKLLKKTE